MLKQRALLALLMLLVSVGVLAQTPTTFTYQGRLYNNGLLASGNYALRIRPYTQVTGGSPLAAALTVPAVNVVDGIFSTTLDFGGAVFTGDPVWLEVEVQAPASSFVPLTPRQPVTPTPYAMHAGKLDGLDAAQLGGVIPFSTGIIISGATMVSAAPRLMGFGSSTVEVIDGGGESTMPPEAGGFSFPMPYDGTIRNLQISADLLVASVVSINTLGLEYDFTVFRAPSSPNNGVDHLAQPFVTTPLTGSLRFGFPNSIATAGTFRAATASIPGSLQVAAGDRIGVRIRTRSNTDASAADVTQLSFSATLSYVPDPQP